LIPIISQILLLDDPPQELPKQLRMAINSVRSAFAQCRYTIYDNETLRGFIAKNYERDVLAAYDVLRPYSYKADLGRFCLLHTMGGWYFDVAVTVQTGIVVGEGVELMAFRDIQRNSRTSWSCQTAALYSRPKNPVLRTAIDMIIRNCRDRYYGVTPLCPTGPTLLGEALAAHRANACHLFGDFLELTPTYPQKNRAFVLDDGAIFAWGKRAEGGDLTALGIRGGNNYNDLWTARKIYELPT